MYLMFTTYPQVFSQQYHFNTGITGLVYIGLGLGVAVGTLVVTMYSDKIMIAKAAKKGRASSPEDRLVLMIYGVPMVPIGLFWYGWSAQASLQFMVPIIGTFFLGLGTLSTSVSDVPYLRYLVLTILSSFQATFTWWTPLPSMLRQRWRL